MCGRFTAMFTWEELFNQLQGFLEALDPKVINEIRDAPPRANIGPTQPILVLHTTLDGPRKVKPELMRWGYVPAWVKDPQDFPLIINARSETINEKPSFRGALRHHRCIIPASGYYEWRTGPDGKKQPYYITLKNGEIMALAGVYATWMGPDGNEIDTAAVITTKANKTLRHIHERMPVMIGESQVRDWLNVEGFSDKKANDMLVPADDNLLEFHPVSTRVNSVRNDDPKLIEPVSEEKPEPPKKKASAQGELF